MFTTELDEILKKVEEIDPVEYSQTRNFLDGAVTKLSPYISRGVLSTKYVFESVLARGFNPKKIEKFIQELAWRDYFQKVWVAKGDTINEDINQEQTDVNNHQMPKAVIDAETGINIIDNGINDLYETGYVHNHQRMYIASVTCNIGKSYWKVPAKWFYYHLFDADWASNTLSWQWVAGAFSRKKYYANQANLNKYSRTNQKHTFLDVEYEDFPELKIPEVLMKTVMPNLETELPAKQDLEIDNTKPTLIYNFYNLDPFWIKDLEANRILLLEPSHFEKYPISSKTLEFVLKLSGNIERIQIYTGEFDELISEYDLKGVYFKEHPTAEHYIGNKDERDWLFPEVQGYFPSFFKYYNQGKKFLKRETLF